MRNRRLLRAILSDPILRRKLFIGVIRATQAREGIDTSEEQAGRAYDFVQSEIRCNRLHPGR